MESLITSNISRTKNDLGQGNASHDFETFVEALCTRAARQADRLAYVYLENGETEGAGLTYGDLDANARSIAVRLRDVCAPGDRVLLFYPPGLEFISAFFGCLYAGVIAVPLHPPRPHRDMSRVLSVTADCGATVALTTAAMAAQIAAGCREFPCLADLAWVASDECCAERTSRWREPELNRDSLALLQYTSGSTSEPKGVMVSHDNLLWNSEGIRRVVKLDAGSVSVTWLPNFHDMGLIEGILQPMYTGFRTYIMAPVDFLQRPIRWLQAVSRYRANQCGSPNFGYEWCVERTRPEERVGLDLTCWRSAYCGSEPIRAATAKRFHEVFSEYGLSEATFYPCYGLAEATLMVTGDELQQPARLLDADASALEHGRLCPVAPGTCGTTQLVSSGRPIIDTGVRIVDPNSRDEVSDGQIGEIWVHGSSIAQGYWSKPDETEQTFRAFTGCGNGPHLRTGDLGAVLDGHLYVTGRIKDLIIIRGRNHYPQDIEATVQQVHPALRRGCGAAFSVDRGGRERLVVVQELDRQASQIPIADLIGDIRQAVVETHDVDVYDVVLLRHASIPKTTSGKIRRGECRIGYENRSLLPAKGATFRAE